MPVSVSEIGSSVTGKKILVAFDTGHGDGTGPCTLIHFFVLSFYQVLQISPICFSSQQSLNLLKTSGTVFR